MRTRFTAAATDLAGLERVPFVDRVSRLGDVVEVSGDASTPVLVAAELAPAASTADFTVIRPSLEDVFVTLTTGDPS